MAQFTVNGKTVTVEKNQKLMRYLRDELRLLSVKDGCAEGACGACTIIFLSVKYFQYAGATRRIHIDPGSGAKGHAVN